MSIVSKVFVVLVMLAGLAFVVLASAELKLQQSHREVVNRLEASIKQQAETNKRLLEGDPPGAGGVRDLELRLHETTVGRGRVWTEIQPTGVEADVASGAVKVNLTVGKPAPTQLAAEMSLFLFSAATAETRAQYLGQYKVVSVAEQAVVVSPVHKLSAAEMERVRGTAGPWLGYEQMPGDTFVAFAGLAEDKKQELLPASTAAEYVRDGKASQAGDPAERVVDGKYRRALRDYMLLFTEYLRQRAVRVDELAAAKSEFESLEKAVADAKQQVAFHEQQIADLRQDLAQFERERDAVGQRLATLKRDLGQSQQEIAQLLDRNQELAGQLATQQLEALRRADELTGADLSK